MRPPRPSRCDWKQSGSRRRHPEVIVKHAEYLDVSSSDVPDWSGRRSTQGRSESEGPKSPASDGRRRQTPAETEPGAQMANPKKSPMPTDVKGRPAVKKDEPKEEARGKEADNRSGGRPCAGQRDPGARPKWIRSSRRGGHVHQDPANKDELGTDIPAKRSKCRLTRKATGWSTGSAEDRQGRRQLGRRPVRQAHHVRVHIVIDQRDNTSAIKGQGSMEIISRRRHGGQETREADQDDHPLEAQDGLPGGGKADLLPRACRATRKLSRSSASGCKSSSTGQSTSTGLQTQDPAKKLKPGEKKEDTIRKSTRSCASTPPRTRTSPSRGTARPVTRDPGGEGGRQDHPVPKPRARPDDRQHAVEQSQAGRGGSPSPART